jgi:TonB family protein
VSEATLLISDGRHRATLIVLGGLLLFPGLPFTKSGTGSSSKDTSPLSLRVERSADELRVSWNRDADAIQGATRAVLEISDGERHQNVDLNLAQLRDGSIVYSPASFEVNFQLTVTGKDASRMQSESVRVLRMPPLATPDPTGALPAKPVPKGTNASNDLSLPPSKATQQDAGAGKAKPPNGASPRPFQADTLVQRSGQAKAVDPPDAPGLSSGTQPQVAVSIPGNVAAPAPPPVSQPQVAPSAAPPVVPGPRVGGTVREAQILTQTAPEFPLAARQARVQGSVVIMAVVGTDGHVKSAKALSGPPLLRNPAVAAVRQWVYKPATLDGIPVETQTQLTLNFSLQR